MKRCFLFGLLFILSGIANPQMARPKDSWAVVVPWHGGGQNERNCYQNASELKATELTQTKITGLMDKPGDSCIQYFYPASTTAANIASVQTQMQNQIDKLKADVKTLSDINDTLMRRLTEMETKLSELQQSK